MAHKPASNNRYILSRDYCDNRFVIDLQKPECYSLIPTCPFNGWSFRLNSNDVIIRSENAIPRKSKKLKEYFKIVTNL